MQLDSELLEEFVKLHKQHEILEERILSINARHAASSEAFLALKKQSLDAMAEGARLNAEVKALLEGLRVSVAVLQQEVQALSNKIDANLLNMVKKE